MELPNVYLVGGAGAGKSITAQFLIETLDYRTAKFAYPVYDIARNYFGMKEKDRKMLQLIGTEAGRDFIDRDIWVKRFIEDTKIANRAAQLMNLGGFQFVSDDVRFRNEHELLKAAGWMGFYLESPAEKRLERLQERDGRTQQEALGHQSELEMESFKGELIAIDASVHRDELFKAIFKLITEEALRRNPNA